MTVKTTRIQLENHSVPLNMTNAEFNEIMEKGLMQAKADESEFAQNVFADLRKRVER